VHNAVDVAFGDIVLIDLGSVAMKAEISKSTVVHRFIFVCVVYVPRDFQRTPKRL
jgi:hypothetical protein